MKEVTTGRLYTLYKEILTCALDLGRKDRYKIILERLRSWHDFVETGLEKCVYVN